VARLGPLLVRALRDAGARLLLGTDETNPFIVAGFSVHDELALFVEAGLSPYEALRAGTATPAEFLGLMGEFGVVAEGARADLVLVSGNPLEDVGHARRPVGVMVRGRWLGREELDGMLALVAEKHAR
jgi:imidazolonepropionase-like amidohydrolase